MRVAQSTSSPALLLLLLLLPLASIIQTVGAQEPAAVNIPPSQFWDGNDGPWSTFRIEVGTPPQQIRVLPGSSQSSSWLVLPEACAGDDECAESRGQLYNRTRSSTWDQHEEGFFELNTYLERRVGLVGDGFYGYDAVSLGWKGDNMPTAQNQSIAGIISPDFWLPSLSLNPRPVNFTDHNNPTPSLLQSLKDAANIPSLTWSYTAGAFNQVPKVFGSLVLGGYDAARFLPNDIIFPFGIDISFDFEVAIQAITTGSTPLLTTGIISHISTLVADIWLPARSCSAFEEVFGLEWDEQVERYWINGTFHEELVRLNPVVTFEIGPKTTGNSVTIELPYWNFYQTASANITGNSSRLYFPLKRAANYTQHILGRAFLQSAYLSADYERNTFNLSQALYPDGPSEIVSIASPQNGTSGDQGSQSVKDANPSGLETGAIAGVAVGAVAGVALLAIAAFLLYRRRKSAKKTNAHELDDAQATTEHEFDDQDGGRKHEVGFGLPHEVNSDTYSAVELYAKGEHHQLIEVDGGGNRPVVYEMPAEHALCNELEGDGSKRNYPEMDGEGLPAELPKNARPYPEEMRIDDETNRAWSPVDTKSRPF